MRFRGGAGGVGKLLNLGLRHQAVGNCSGNDLLMKKRNKYCTLVLRAAKKCWKILLNYTLQWGDHLKKARKHDLRDVAGEGLLTWLMVVDESISK